MICLICSLASVDDINYVHSCPKSRERLLSFFAFFKLGILASETVEHDEMVKNEFEIHSREVKVHGYYI